MTRNLAFQVQRLFTFALSLATAAAVTLSGCTKTVDDKDTTIYAVLKQNVKGLDPAISSDLYSTTVIAQIFEGLLEYNYLKRPYTLQPALAEAMPVISDNGLTYTFKIKKNVHFQDNAAFANGKGRELKAKDFIYSFKRLSDPRITSDGFWIFDQKIKGLNEWAAALQNIKGDAKSLEGKALFDKPIEGLSAPDDYTLVIKLTKPYYQLNYVLAMSYASVIPQEAVERYGAEFLNNPVGTGPFMLAKASDWVRNSKVTLIKNPNWRGETYPTEGEPGDAAAGLLTDSGKPLPFAERLVFTELPEDQPRWQNLVKGNFDFAEVPNDNFDSVVNKEDHKVLKPDVAQKGIKLSITSTPEIVYTGINMKDALLGKNKPLRHALALANDEKSFIDKFYNGAAILGESPVPPDLDSYDPSFKNPYQRHDLAKAKEALAQAGFPEGKGLPELTYDALADSKSRQQAEAFAQNVAAIGIKVRIIANTWPQFTDKIKHDQTQLFGIAWGADYPDAQGFYQLFYSKNVSPGPNDSGFTNTEFDKIYEQSLLLPNRR